MNDLFNMVESWIETPKPESNGTSSLKTHPWLTLRAIQLFEEKYGKDKLTKDQEIAIIQGSIEEDYDIEGTATEGGIYSNVKMDEPLTEKNVQSHRCLNHFMPGLVFSALQWATTAENNATKYSDAVREAKAGHVNGWRYLGHILHLLQDMTVPAHVLLDPHMDSNIDTYELELRKLNITDYCNKVGNCNKTNLGEPKTINTDEPDPYFIQLAAHTRDNFYSDDRYPSNLSDFPSSIVKCKDDSTYLCNSNIDNGNIQVADSRGWLNSLLKVPSSLGSEKKYYKITDKVVASMFSYLGLQAVQYGAGLIKLFYYDVNPINPVIAQTKMSVNPGETVTQSGTGFTPNSIATLHFRKPDNTEFTPLSQAIEPDGTFSIAYTVPTDRIAGTYTWWGVDSSGEVSNMVSYTVADFSAIGIISGHVTISDTGKPLLGAAIRLDIPNSYTQVTTDSNGYYSLPIPSLGNYFLMSVGKDGYIPQTANISKNNLLASGSLTQDFALKAAHNNVLILEIVPEVHHLGDDVFNGSFNSQFQQVSEGIEYIDTFITNANQLPPYYKTAELHVTVKGTECYDPVYINNVEIGSFYGSPSDGSFGEIIIPLNDISILKTVSNTLRINTVECNTFDDFEYANILIYLYK